MAKYALRLLLFAAFAAFTLNQALASSFVVGGFDASRGGFESLAPGEDSALATDIQTAFPGSSFQFTNTLTSSFLNGVNVVILGVATTDFSATTPLSSSEQTALYNFVHDGGTALIFTDNSTFDPNAPTVNNSFAAPFGVTVAGTLNGGITLPLLNPTGPLTSPFTPANSFSTSYPGYYTSTNGGQILAEFNSDPGEAAVLYFKAGSFGPNSGTVVLFSDSDSMVANDALTNSNLNLMLNAFHYTGTTATTPEPGTLALLGTGLLGLFGTIRRK